MEFIKDLTLQNWCQIYTVWYVLCCIWAAVVNDFSYIWEDMVEGFMLSIGIPALIALVLGMVSFLITVTVFAITGVNILN